LQLVAIGGKSDRRGSAKSSQTVAAGCHRLPIGARGKEGVSRFESVRGLYRTLEHASKNQKETSMEMECKRITSEHRACRVSLIGLTAALAK
jgi:hypothetical protein